MKADPDKGKGTKQMTVPRYYVLRDGERLGPFTREELAQLVSGGALDDLTELEDEEGRKTLLAEVFPEKPPPAAAPPRPEPLPSSFHQETTTRDKRPAAASFSLQRWIQAAVFAFAGGYFLLCRPATFIDWIDVPFHEAGHVFFSFFGEFVGFLGGTLMQLLIPGVAAFTFARGGRTLGVQFALFWLGQSFLNVARYAADARAVNLPLIGGEHDWNYLLGKLDLLQYDATVGAFFVALGAVSFLAAAVWPFLIGLRR
ncbi:MAG: DUF4339 domain-containing protein [Firmicutes bacterium]|nr:DUF4339 domain-containing protein [Bacillota bacterium]